VTLVDPAGFEIGDVIAQGTTTTGRIVSKVGDDFLVHVDGLETFQCFAVCASLVPLTNQNGASSYIAKGGMTRRLGPLFMARNLLDLRDIDTTIDLFINFFKEKYLRNIEFDTQTNKKLLVKNSLDLYRSKGTERSIDLFFRLVYGVNAKVYYPGDDLFKLSAGQWSKPQYIEIAESSVSRAVSLVGKSITGATSKATAFVEKYIIRKIKGGSVHILYVSNVKGTFVNREPLQTDIVYTDSPIVLGSLNAVDIVTGGADFAVGDVVMFDSGTGDYGLARVTEIANKTGVVDFLLTEGGWGYTTSADTSLSDEELAKRTQSIVSEHVVTVTDVITSNTVSVIEVVAGGTGYSNADIAKVTSPYVNATAQLTTNSTGGIVSLALSNKGSGFFTLNPPVAIANSTGGASAGSGATLMAKTTAHDSYYKYFEKFVQPLFNVTYNAATNAAALSEGSLIRTGNSTVNTAFGYIVSNDGVNQLVVSTSNNTSFGSGNTIYLISDSGVTANAQVVEDVTTTADVMGLPVKGTFDYNALMGSPIERNAEIFQLDTSGEEVANAVVSVTGNNYIEIVNLNGVFQSNASFSVRGKDTTANLANITLKLGVYNVDGDLETLLKPGTFSKQTGTLGNVIAASSGTSASFRVGSLSDSEDIFLATDMLGANNTANVPFMDLPLNSLEYGFPKFPTGNSSAIMYSCLAYDSFTIGSIESITSINPGTGYNDSPFVLAYQPFMEARALYDYNITIESTTGSFQVGERVTQSNVSTTGYNLVVTDETGYTLGEKVYQGNSSLQTATGIISEINGTANTILVANVTGTFVANTLKSFISTSLSANVISVTPQEIEIQAKGTIKAGSNTSVLKVKRLQLDNHYIPGQSLTGRSSGATAVITEVSSDMDSPRIGVNANISANVTTANGSVRFIEVTDSGLGYTNGEIVLFTSTDGERSGEAKIITGGLGTGSGYYKTTKGFLSSISKLHDGDYYQEYSYDVMSRIPLERYADMFKKVMHTAGTRYFGSMLLEDDVEITIGVSSSIEQTVN
jgi:hypothetical protein